MLEHFHRSHPGSASVTVVPLPSPYGTVDIGVEGPVAAGAVLGLDLMLAGILHKDLRRGLRFSAALAWLYLTISAARCFMAGRSSALNPSDSVLVFAGMIGPSSPGLHGRRLLADATAAHRASLLDSCSVRARS